jgi:hypothetical protein
MLLHIGAPIHDENLVAVTLNGLGKYYSQFRTLIIDVWTTKTESIGGCRYYVSFIDDHTRKV